jgi:serine/threonine protein kinase
LSAILEDPNTSELKLARKWPADSFVDDDETATLSGKPESREPAREPFRLADPVPGATLASRYLLKDVIGRGGDAIVFRAEDRFGSMPGAEEPVDIAIKVLLAQQRANPDAVARLKLEFEYMRSLSHPGIARVFELGKDGETEFMTMELVAGRKLSEWLREPHRPRERIRIIEACAEALAYVHGRGLLHGDLKLANVLVCGDGSVRLVDFGTGRAIADSLSARLPVVTASYASPQVLDGAAAEVRDEIFSLACLSYVVLSGGIRPFGDMSPLEASRVGAVPALIADVPAPMLDVLIRSLGFEREARPASVEEFLAAWKAPPMQRHEPVAEAEPTTVPAPAPMPVRTPQAAAQPEGMAIPPTEPEPEPEPEPAIAPVSPLAPNSAERRRQPRRRHFGRVPAILTAIAAVGALAALTYWPESVNRETPPPLPQMKPVVAKTEGAPIPPATEPEAQPAPPVAPQPRGQVTFDTPVVHVPSAQTLVAIPIRRTNSTRGVGLVAWTIEPYNARPGVDYQPVDSQVVRFNDGQVVRSLFIPLLQPGSSTDLREPRSFVVKLSQIPGGTSLGSVTRTTVTIDP